ncbi:19166_t:CDS:1, partial [Funneliformis geosporum]
AYAPPEIRTYSRNPGNRAVDPRMVIEIGKTENLDSLNNLAEVYFSAQTNIQIYLTFKVYGRMAPAQCSHCAISFGTAPLYTHLLEIPVFRIIELLAY